MTVICCVCQETIGERALSEKKLATSFVWRNQGLCPDCFDRARTAIARAYNHSLPDLRRRPVGEGSAW